jgi:hypothetical protein
MQPLPAKVVSVQELQADPGIGLAGCVFVHFLGAPVRPRAGHGWTHPLLEMVDSAVAADLVPIQLVPM